MKIKKFKKLKNGQYQLFLEDDTSIIVHEDLILKYDLLLQKKISPSMQEKILEENLSYIAYDLAVKYLAKKMRSELEIKEYLLKQKVDSTIISSVIEKLKGQGYLNEKDYVQSYFADKINFSFAGPLKIEKELLALGISMDSVAIGKASFPLELEEERIKKIIERMVKNNRNKSEVMLRKKIQEYLILNGYTPSIVSSLLSKIKVKTDETIQKKEYDKIYKKLSRKYSGNELEYKVRQKMYALGFHNNMDE